MNNLFEEQPAAERFISKHGVPVLIRVLTAADTELLVDLFDRLSPQTRYLRFFQPVPALSHEEIYTQAAKLAAINPDREEALVALVAHETGQQAVGVARLVIQPGKNAVAEAAIVVCDSYQRQGIGEHLFRLLIERARARQITTITAVTFAENRAVIYALRQLGIAFRSSTHAGETMIEVFIA